MSGFIHLTPNAIDDLDIAFEYLAERNPTAAHKFNEAARKTLEQLAVLPGLGVTRQYDNPQIVDVRMFRMQDFRNYLIFYNATEDGIRVIRILHGARNVSKIFELTED